MFGIFGFIGIIFIIILFIVLFVLAILGNFIRSIFGFGKRTPKHHKSEQQEAPKQTSYSNKKKIFDKDEGEYIEFEEIE